MAVIKPHALAVALPAQGHTNPLMRLCKVLASHDILITFVEHSPSSQHLPIVVQDTESSIRRARLPFQTIKLGKDVEENSKPSQSEAVLEPLLAQLLASLLKFVDQLSHDSTPITFLISDISLSSVAQEISATFHVPFISFSPFPQSKNLLFVYIANGNLLVENALNAVAKNDAGLLPYTLPGLPPLRNRDLPYFDGHPNIHETDYMYRFLCRQIGIASKIAEMIVVNTFEELEGPALEVKPTEVPVYSIGPLIEELSGDLNTSVWKEQDDCLDWLDKQPESSVLYISMGSYAAWSNSQFEEILYGLEASNQRFLWVVRPGIVEGTSIMEGKSSKELLPEWFLASTKARGYIVSWAPQMRVLGHASVGGFLTHCGWNSTIEAVVKGVIMLCWPCVSDQYMNCRLVVEEWKIGMRLRGDRGVLVGRDEIEKVITVFMNDEEGNVLRKNAFKLCQASLQSLQPGGSSHAHMQTLLHRLTQHTHH